MKESGWNPEMDCGRLLALSDGIFAVSLTLGIAEIMPPGLHQRIAAEGTAAVLRDLAPQIAWASITFLLVGFYWVSHHRNFSYIRRTDEDFLTLNLLFLLGIAFLPFSIAVVQAGDRASVVDYAAFLTVIGLLQNRIWAYATRKRRLVDRGLSPEIIRYNHYRSLIAPLVFLASIGIARASLIWARNSWLLLVFNRPLAAWLAKRGRPREA